MNKKKVRAALKRFDHLVGKVEKLDASLAVEFDALRTQILNIQANDDWREHLAFWADVSRDEAELARFVGVSEKSVRSELRRRGVGKLKPGPKTTSTKYPFRNSVPDFKPRKT